MMAKSTIPAPPIEILTEYLCALSRTAADNDGIVHILRGSFLLRHWFGALARPVVDIDLECFELTTPATYDRFGTAANYAKTLCMYATDAVWYDRSDQNPPIVFREADVPADGTSLWEYGTPGERCYAGWVWNARDGMTGLLQIDIAVAGVYDFAFVSVSDIELVDSKGAHCRMPAYTPEMLLAAKLSWLVRSLKPQDNSRASRWNGELKDLFDVYLLVTRGKLRAQEIEKSMLAVAAEDKLDWKSLDVLFDAQCAAMTDEDFPIWPDFQRAFPEQISCGPAEMLRIVAERVGPLLAGIREHVPFLTAIDADSVDEVPYLIYADWLQERGDPRGDFLRLAILWSFHEDELSTKERANLRQALKLALQKTPTPWLYHLFGSAQRFREFKQKLEA